MRRSSELWSSSSDGPAIASRPLSRMYPRLDIDSARRTFCSMNRMAMPSRFQRLEHALHLLHDLRSKTEKRLVHHQQTRQRHQPAAERQHLLLAAGERARELALRSQRRGKERIDPLQGFGARRFCGRMPGTEHAGSAVRSGAGRRGAAPARGRCRARRVRGSAARPGSRRRSAMSPGLGADSSPVMVLTTVLLPEPLGPSSATLSPAATVSETPHTT